MKKVLVILFLLASAFTYAQKLQFGIKAGANISNFNDGDFSDVKTKSLIGFHGGVYTRLSLGAIALQPEIMISTQGAKLDSISGNGSSDWKLTYINIPVMLQIQSGGGLYIEAGPQVGFKVSEDIGGQTVDNFAKNLDFSVAGGFGFRSKKGLGLGARYNLGISKVGDIPSSTSNIDPDFKNAVIQISLYIPLTQ